MHFGPSEIFVALSLDFDDELPAAEVESAVTRIERKLRESYPEIGQVFIEAQGFDADRRGSEAAEA